MHKGDSLIRRKISSTGAGPASSWYSATLPEPTAGWTSGIPSSALHPSARPFEWCFTRLTSSKSSRSHCTRSALCSTCLSCRVPWTLIPTRLPTPNLRLLAWTAVTAPVLNQFLIAAYLDIRPYLYLLPCLSPPPVLPRFLAFPYPGPTPSSDRLYTATRILHTYSQCCDLLTVIELQSHLEVEAQFTSAFPSSFNLHVSNPHLPLESISPFFMALLPALPQSKI